MYTPCVGVAYSRAWIHGTENVYKMKRIYYWQNLLGDIVCLFIPDLVQFNVVLCRVFFFVKSFTVKVHFAPSRCSPLWVFTPNPIVLYGAYGTLRYGAYGTLLYGA
jgi:hypothetical protein